MSTIENFDVIIIGGGISGLVCADELLMNRKNDVELKVLVLEGSDRVGGRTKTIDLEYSDNGGNKTMKVDVGGMWLGPTQTEMLKLCDRFQIKTVQQYFFEGTHITTRGTHPDSFRTYKGEIPPYSIFSLLEIQFLVLSKVQRLMSYIDLESPEKCSYAKEWDSESVASYISKRLWTQSSRELVELCCESLLGCSASQVSLLYFLYMCKANDGLTMLIDATGGAQDRRMVGGAQQISERLLESIQSLGGKLYYNAKVTCVEYVNQSSDGYPLCIKCRDGQVFKSKVCVSAGCGSKFIQCCEFIPSLPRYVRKFSECTFRGAYGKAVIVYKTAWWRTLGFSGFCTNASPTSEACAAFGYDYGIDPPALVFFVTGNLGETMCEKEEQHRRESILRSVDVFFPGKHPREQVLTYHDEFWQTNEFSGGAPMTVYPPGTFSAYSAQKLLRKPFAVSTDLRPLLFFAGTDVSTRWVGYMEGACIRGREVAQEILTKVNFGSQPQTLTSEENMKQVHWVSQ